MCLVFTDPTVIYYLRFRRPESGRGDSTLSSEADIPPVIKSPKPLQFAIPQANQADFEMPSINDAQAPLPIRPAKPKILVLPASPPADDDINVSISFRFFQMYHHYIYIYNIIMLTYFYSFLYFCYRSNHIGYYLILLPQLLVIYRLEKAK